MKILVDEEYGFSYWLWEPEVNGENLVRLFQQVVLTDEKFFVNDNYKKQLGGTWEKLDYEEFDRILGLKECEAYAFLHDSEDSFLTFWKNQKQVDKHNTSG
jgi:hypothetical protein|tara:strand:+ start:299 stop:601 length:303 start_codon:yes stop_codon:yes gene_type:complete